MKRSLRLSARAVRACALLWSFILIGCAGLSPKSTGPESTAGRFEVTVLGIAQDGGLPHLGCEKECCTSARATGRELYPACLGVRDTETGKLLLLEATPAIEKQLTLWYATSGVSGRGRRPCDALLLTHAHVGHYTGLIQLGREVASVKNVPTYVTPRFAEFLRSNGPWSQLVELGQIALREVTPGVAFEVFPGLVVEAIAVPHRDEYSDTVAWKLTGPSGTILFVPDVDGWGSQGRSKDSSDRSRLDALLTDDVTTAYLDATFYDGRELPGRDLSEIPHPPVIRTMELLGDQAAQSPGRFRFIHLNHTNPLLRDAALREDLERRGFRVAEQGEQIRF